MMSSMRYTVSDVKSAVALQLSIKNCNLCIEISANAEMLLLEVVVRVDVGMGDALLMVRPGHITRGWCACAHRSRC